MLLSRIGVNIIVYDFDTVEATNLGGQLYGAKHIKSPKVVALSSVVAEFSDAFIDGVSTRYDSESIISEHAFAAFDNIEARRIMFNRWENYIDGPDYRGSLRDAVFIDGRLTMEQLQIFVIRGDNGAARSDYRTNQLPDDSRIPDAPCTLKQTSHSAAMIASHMVGFYTNHLTNMAVGDNERYLPFMWEYFIPLAMVTDREVHSS